MTTFFLISPWLDLFCAHPAAGSGPNPGQAGEDHCDWRVPRIARPCPPVCWRRNNCGWVIVSQVSLRMVNPYSPRKRWPLPAVEIEANGDSWSIYEKGSSLLVRWLVMLVQEILVLPWLLSLAQYKLFFRLRTLFHFIRPHRLAR